MARFRRLMTTERQASAPDPTIARMASTLAHVTPEVLRWARESIGFELELAAQRIGVKPEKLEGAESGDLMLTLRQAERAADLYERPLAALFLPEPPAEEPQEAQFRRLRDAPEPPWPPEMQLLVRRVRDRQESADELYEVLDEQPPWLETLTALTEVREPSAETARTLLSIGFDEQTSWRDASGYAPMRHWTDAIEGAGILVLQDGTLPVEMMRGFAATHATVPAIVINTRDDPRSRAFTLLHELGHLYLAALDVTPAGDVEAWADTFAADVLMPRAWVQTITSSLRGTRLEVVDALALRLGVTPLAAAVRLATAGLWAWADTLPVIEQIQARPPRQGGSGGDYYRTQIGRLSPAYTRLVFTALDSQAVTYPAASSLLDGVKVSNFDKLREYLARRATQE